MTKGEFIWDGVIRQLPSWWFDMNTKKAPPSQPSSTVGENHDGDQTVGWIKGDLIWYQGQEYKGNTQNTMMKKTTPRNVVIVMAEDGRRVQPWERRLVFLVNISFVGTKKPRLYFPCKMLQIVGQYFVQNASDCQKKHLVPCHRQSQWVCPPEICLMINDEIVVGDEDVDRQVVEDDGDLSMAGEADSGKDLWDAGEWLAIVEIQLNAGWQMMERWPAYLSFLTWKETCKWNLTLMPGLAHVAGITLASKLTEEQGSAIILRLKA